MLINLKVLCQPTIVNPKINWKFKWKFVERLVNTIS
jgi:hypothetical protein